jgi:N,N-dimethylformamidase
VAGSTGPAYLIPFVVRQGFVAGAIAVIVNVNTWNAYNIWGGANNYTHTADDGINLTHKRPNHHLLISSQDHISGSHLLRSEIWLADWLRSRHACDFITDIDLHNQPDLSQYKALVIGTHPEYWTQAMITAVVRYLNGGGSLLYLAGNGMYRPTSLFSEHGDGQFDTTSTANSVWPSFPLYEGKPLFAAQPDQPPAKDDNLPNGGMPAPNTGMTIQAGAPFVPHGFTTAMVGASGWNPAPLYDPPVSGSWGASGWETDTWRQSAPPGVEVIGRDLATPDNNGAVMGVYRTSAGGFVMGAASITFVGAMMTDATLQAIVENALADAVSR